MTGVTRGSSPTLIGRDPELAALCGAIEAARTSDRPVVLVSGEAGIGKSRLLAEFEASAIAAPPAGRPVRFLHGSCVEVGEGLAYLPILDWLDDLERGDEADPAAVAGLRAALGGMVGRSTDAAAEDPGSSRSFLFQRLRELLVAPTATDDVVAIIDDLHWADRSTLDVVAYLARRLVGTGVLLVLVYRSDELHRRHALTPVIAELERRSVLDHVRLEPLGAGDVSAQIAAIVGQPVETSRVGRVVELADGNPFHVEELLALEGTGALPSSLRDVLGARLGAIDDDTLEVVRQAAVIGRRVDGGLLIVVARTEPAATEAGLRSAVDARILVSDPDGRRYRFRHALLREAVYDEILPSERVAAHRRIAEALVAEPRFADPNPSVAAADLARHWLGAHAEPEAFVALIETGRAAWSAGAMAEGRHAYEEALALWDRVPDPLVGGVPRSRLLQDAAALTWYDGDTRRALELNLRTQAEPDVQADPWRLGRLLEHTAWYYMELRDVAASEAAAHRAAEVIPRHPPTAELAGAIGTLGAFESVAGRMRSARPILEEALEISISADSWSAILASQAHLAYVYAELGLESLAEAALDEAWASLERNTVDDSFFALTTNAPWVWLALGRYQHAIDDAERSLAIAQQRGVDVGGGAWYTSPWSEALYRSGRWDAALATIASATAFASAASPEMTHRAVTAMIHAGRGRSDEARRLAREAVELGRAGWADEVKMSQCSLVWVELLAGDPNAAAAAVRIAVDAAAGADAVVVRAELAAMAAWVAAEVSAHGGNADRADDLAAYAAELERSLRTPGEIRDGIDTWLDVAAAFLARRDGRDVPDDWSTAAEGFERIGARPMAAIARQGEVEAILQAGGPMAEAERAARAALAHIDAMGADGLRDRLGRVTRAARLDMSAGSDSTESTGQPSASSDAARRPVGPLPARAGGPRPADRGPDQRPDRRGAVHQRQDGLGPRDPHPRQAGGLDPGRGRTRRRPGRVRQPLNRPVAGA